MQSINELNRSSERQSELPPTQSALYQIFPKELLSDEIYIQSIHDFNEPTPSINELPKFASGSRIQQAEAEKQESSWQMNKMLLTTQHAQFVINSKIKTQRLIFDKQEESQSSIILLKSIIWLCYFLSSAQNKFQNITTLHLIDFTGIAIAFVLVFVQIVKQRQADLEHAIHLLSLAATVTLHFYPAEDSFTWSLLVIRSLRLFFPLNFNHGFKVIFLKYGTIILRVFKASVPLLFTVTLFSLLLISGSSSSIYNRCRAQTSLGIISAPVDQMLCGSRQCPEDYECINPLLYKIKPNNEQYQLSSNLGYGFFLLSNLYRSFFTVMSLGSLSQSAHIVDIYVNAIPGYWLAFCSMLAFISIQFGLIPMLVIMIESTLQQETKQQDDPANIMGSVTQPLQPRADPARKSLSEGFSAAPTFGVIKNEGKVPEQRMPSNESDRGHSLNSFLKSQSNKPNHLVEIKQEAVEDSAHTNKIFQQSTIQQIIKYLISILYVTISITQLLFAIVYAFRLAGDTENRTIGIGLMCFFVVWTFKIILSAFNKYFDEQSQKEAELNSIQTDNQEMIFKIESFIYTVHLLDYICRIMQRVYIMEDVSVITPLATASLVLRVLYIPLAGKTSSSLINQVKIFAKIQNSIVIYILLMVVVSSFFAILSRGHSDETFSVQTIKYFTTFANSNWIEVYVNQPLTSTQNHTSGLRFAIKFFLILTGQLLMLRFLYAESISVAIFNMRKNNIEIPQPEILETPTNQQILNEIKSQKSLFLFQYTQNSLRESLHKILQRNAYRNFKQKLLESYIIISYFGEIMIKKSEIFIYSLMTISALLLADAFISIIALRFWGKHSFVNYNWYQLINFIISFIIIANAINPFMDIAFMRVFRVLLLISLSVNLKQGYGLIVNFIKIFLRVLPFFLTLWCFFTMICICITVENHQGASKLSLILKSFGLGIQMFKNGFDLVTALKVSNDFSKLFAFQSSLLSLMIGIPFNCMCIMLILKYLSEQRKQQEQIAIKQIIVKSKDLLNHHQAEEKMEIDGIKEHILAITPQVKPEAFLKKGYLLELISTKPYQYFGFFVCTIGLVLVLFITLLCTTLSGEVLFYLKLAKIFFFIVEISLFALECIAFQATTSHFKLNLMLYMLSTPGHFLLLVPFDQLLVSNQLQQLLFVLVSFTPIALINFFLGNNCQYTSVFYFIYRKIHRTCWLLLLALTFCWLFGSLLTLFLKQEMVVVMSKLVIGLLGGPFERFLGSEELPTKDKVATYVLISIFNLLAFALRTGIIAMFLFQISDKIRQTVSSKQANHVLTRQVFNKEFNESKFLELWSRLDQKGTGILPYSVAFHNMFNFVKIFRMYKRYLSFIIATKAEIFKLKLGLFRELCIPIRTVNIIDSDGNKHTEYIVTIYDLICRFFCLALSENEESMLQAEEKPSSKLAEIMGLGSTQWSQSIVNRFSELNKKRKEERQIEEKFIVLKHVDMQSRVLSTIINILPILRRRLLLARQKIKGQ